MADTLKLEVCAFFADEFRAALAAEGRFDVGIVLVHGACDERRWPAAPGAPALRLMGVCSGRAACPKSLHSCFELLLGPDKVETLLGMGAHLLTPAMVRAYPETLLSLNEKPENLHACFAESVHAWVVVDSGMSKLTASEQAAFQAATGGKIELLPTELHLLRANLRAILAQGDTAAIEARAKAQIASLQHRLADYTMAYDLIGRLIPHQGEQTIIQAILELFYLLCAPRAVHLMLAKEAGNEALEAPVQFFSLPEDSGQEDRFRAFLFCQAAQGELESPQGFYFQIPQEDGKILGVVLVEGEFLPQHRYDYLELARLLMPILRLALHNARSFERLCNTERELRASQMELEQRVVDRTRELRESETRFRNLVETSSDWIWEIDENAVYTYTNPKIKDILGYDVVEIIGKSPFDFMPPEEAMRVAALFGPIAAERLPFANFENSNLHKYGHKVILDTSGVPVIGANGKFCGYRGMNRVITERKKFEEELKRSNAELEQFSYAISHDMRQPLRMISSYLQLLEMSLEGQLDHEKRDYFNFAIDGAKRIDQMLVALLEFSRAGRMGEPPTWVDSRALLDEALQFLQPAILEAQARLCISGVWPRILASHDEMLRLLQNLIGNAAKYRVAGRIPQITASGELAGNEWILSVSDNGVGIVSDQIKRLFQVFQRLHSREAYEGTGIGLALCRKIAEHHKGRIWVESAGVDQGSKFCVALPVLQKNIEPKLLLIPLIAIQHLPPS